MYLKMGSWIVCFIVRLIKKTELSFKKEEMGFIIPSIDSPLAKAAHKKTEPTRIPISIFPASGAESFYG
jgi:hypothetical protein